MFITVVLPLVAGFLIFGSLGLIGQDDSNTVIAYSFLIVIPVAVLASLERSRDLFSPLKILTYILILSSPMFGIYVKYLAEPQWASYAMFWQDFYDLIPGITLVGFSCILIALGYVFGTRHYSPKYSSANQHSISIGRMRLVAYLTLVVSTIAVWRFSLDVNYATSLADDIISRKSIHEATVGISVRGSALTHWRLLGISLPHAVVILYLSLIWTGKIRASKIDYVSILVMLFISFWIPFIASSRSPILEVLAIIIMLHHYLVRRINGYKFVAIGLAGIMILGTLGELRRNQDKIVLATFSSAVQQIVGASYFLDLGKTAIIVNRVPEQVDYLYGSSLAATAFAFIPRQIWPDKPVVRIGPFVGQKIIRLNNQTGIPPGFIAELYINFGYIFVLPFSLLLGYALAVIYKNLNAQRNHRNTVVYVVGIVLITLSLLTTDFAFFVIQLVSYGFPLVVVSKFIRLR